MSEILVIVPPEWTLVDSNLVMDIVSVSLPDLAAMQGHVPSDLTARLVAAGYIDADKRVIDVLVLDNNLYLRIE